MVRLGGWLFKHRTWLPLPVILPLLVVPPGTHSALLIWIGLGMVASGELMRLWGVHHIGVISRTRSDRLGPLVDSGPFAYVRNPLYIGNMLLWVGFAFIARLPWVAPLAVVLLAFEYHAIVRWEETLLSARIGASYDDYLTRVPRWIPRRPRASPSRRTPGRASFAWGDTFFSERGTLIAILAGSVLLWMKR